MGVSFPNFTLLLFSFFFFIFLSSSSFITTITAQPPFKCTINTTCSSLVGYVSPNRTTLSSIQSLFGVKKFRSLLGANNLPLETSPNTTIESQQTIKVPIPCICFNNTGVSNKVPIYEVQPGDGLWHIAVEVFGRLVTPERIQQGNNLANISLIEIGQELWIPLPCSCDQDVVHYAYLVAEGDSLDKIGSEFAVSSEIVKTVNGIANDSQLIVGNVLDLPLRACSSSISSESEDSGLLVSNGTYALTANQCVKCQCSTANNWTLQCEPSGLKPSNWSQCPSMQCVGSDKSLSNWTSSGCDRTTCAYAGFFSTNQTILTTLDTVNTCPAPTAAPGPSNNASRISFWNFLLIFSVHAIVCFLHLVL